jgi:hypothetical protein
MALVDPGYHIFLKSGISVKKDANIDISGSFVEASDNTASTRVKCLCVQRYYQQKSHRYNVNQMNKSTEERPSCVRESGDGLVVVGELIEKVLNIGQDISHR